MVVIDLPKIHIPACWDNCPVNILIVVVFPEPLYSKIQIFQSFLLETDIFRATWFPYTFTKWRTSIFFHTILHPLYPNFCLQVNHIGSSSFRHYFHRKKSNRKDEWNFSAAKWRQNRDEIREIIVKWRQMAVACTRFSQFNCAFIPITPGSFINKKFDDVFSAPTGSTLFSFHPQHIPQLGHFRF